MNNGTPIQENKYSNNQLYNNNQNNIENLGILPSISEGITSGTKI